MTVYGSCVGERTIPEKARVTYEELRQHRSNSRNLSRGVIFGSQYLVRGSWPLIPAQVAIPRKNDRRGCPNIWRWSKRKCVDGMKEACSKLYGGLPKCSSPYGAARTCFRLFRLQNAFGPKKRVTKTVTSTNLGRTRIRMPSSYPAPPAPVPPGVTMATPPGPSAPGVRTPSSLVFLFGLFFCFAPGPIPRRWRPVLSGFFSPFFNPGGLGGESFLSSRRSPHRG